MKVRDGIQVEVVGRLESNCYLVEPPGSGTLYIIDPGSDAEEIVAAAKKTNYTEAAILFTHAHVDHIAAAGEVAKALSIKKIYLHEADAKLYASPNNHLMPYVMAAENLPPTSCPPAENADFSWLHTPGHTKGGVCYFFQKLNAIFSGDTLFRGSIGRTDFPGGDFSELMASIKEGIFKFPDATELFPGHGASTSVGMEKAMNPYVSGEEG
jgi:glyoxylase-like metal-dependent hydrolase (beta-lactamase superfamily II)